MCALQKHFASSQGIAFTLTTPLLAQNAKNTSEHPQTLGPLSTLLPANLLSCVYLHSAAPDMAAVCAISNPVHDNAMLCLNWRSHSYAALKGFASPHGKWRSDSTAGIQGKCASARRRQIVRMSCMHNLPPRGPADGQSLGTQMRLPAF